MVNKIIQNLRKEVIELLQSLAGVIFIFLVIALIAVLQFIPKVGIGFSFLFFLFMIGFIVPRLVSSKFWFSEFKFNTFLKIILTKPKLNTERNILEAILSFLYYLVIVFCAALTTASIFVTLYKTF